MRKLALLTLILIISSLLYAGALDNRQKIYAVDSEVYEAMTYLYLMEGLALPSTTGPWSAAELDLMLSRVNKDRLHSESASRLYSFIEKELSEKPMVNPHDMFSFSIPAELNVQGFAHANNDAFSEPEENSLQPGAMYGDYNQPEPFLSIPLETWIGSGVYGYTSLSLGTVRSRHDITTEIYGDLDGDGVDDTIIDYDYTSKNLSHNIMFVSPSVFDDFSMNFPWRAFGSVGSDYWNISIGRDKLSWGPGESGNFVVGDHIPYHDNIRFTAFTDPFKYTFSISFFAHPINYMTQAADGYYYYTPFFDQDVSRDGSRAFIAHRLEWRIKNKVNMALTEGFMFQNESSFDFMVLSPTAVFHNFYIKKNSNSILSLELDWAVTNHLNLYAQFGLDDFAMPGEEQEAESPNALAYMLGLKFAYPMGKGVFYGSVEGAYTDPYFYLRATSSDEEDIIYGYGNSLVVAIPEFVSAGELANYSLTYLGYRYGGDAIVADIKAGYKVFGEWYAQGRITYVIHGCNDVYTRWSTSSYTAAPTSSSNSSRSYIYGDTTVKNAVEHTVDLSLEGGLQPFPNLDVAVRTDFIVVANKDNLKDNTEADIQFTFALKYSL